MPSKRIAILQSNYIPWKGYFDIIRSVDEFVFYDEVQYTRRDWRNRNLIKTPQGLLWLTVPVNVKNNFTVAIQDVELADQKWRRKHWMSIQNNYNKAPFFPAYKDTFEHLYLAGTETMLSELNYNFINAINGLLGIKTKISWSHQYATQPGKNEKLISICKGAKATHYLSGGAAKSYIDETMFAEAGIQVQWMDYSNYPTYPQFYPPFEHGVSIIDLLFHMGEASSQYMKSEVL